MRFFLFLISPLPLMPAKTAIRKLAAVLPIKLFTSYKVTLINIKLSFSYLNETETLKLAKESYIESLCSLYETLYTLSRSPKAISKNILRVDNKYLFSEPLKADNGLILSGIHNRSVDMLLFWINSQTPTVGVYKPLKNRLLDVHVKKQREQLGSKIFTTSYKGVKELFKAISKNKVILMASDQVPQDGMGEYVNFFGRKAYTTTLVPSLANKTSKPLVFIGLFSAEKNSLKISFTKSPKEISAETMNLTMQKMISKNPKDYSWEYKRFKKPPTDLKNPY